MGNISTESPKITLYLWCIPKWHNIKNRLWLLPGTEPRWCETHRQVETAGFWESVLFAVHQRAGHKLWNKLCVSGAKGEAELRTNFEVHQLWLYRLFALNGVRMCVFYCPFLNFCYFCIALQWTGQSMYNTEQGWKCLPKGLSALPAQGMQEYWKTSGGARNMKGCIRWKGESSGGKSKSSGWKLRATESSMKETRKKKVAASYQKMKGT